VGDGNAAHVSSSLVMKMTNAIEKIFPQACCRKAEFLSKVLYSFFLEL
jgi:hypothetical protein